MLSLIHVELFRRRNKKDSFTLYLLYSHTKDNNAFCMNLMEISTKATLQQIIKKIHQLNDKYNFMFHALHGSNIAPNEG